MTVDPSKPELTATGCLLRVGVALLALSIPVVATLFGYVLYEQNKHQSALATEIQLIRDRGEPLDGADLEKFYRLPDGEKDITDFYTEALQSLSDDAPLGKNAKKLDEFRTLDQRGLEPPHRPDAWPLLAAAEKQRDGYHEVLTKLEQAANQTGSVRYPVDLTNGWHAQLPHVMACRQGGRVLEVQALCHYHRGELSRAANDVVTMIQLAQSLKREPLLVSQLIRMSLLRSVKGLTTYLAADPEISVADLLSIQTALTAVEFDSIRAPIFLSERAAGYAVYSQPHVDQEDENRQVPEGTIMVHSRPGDSAAFLRWQSRAVEVGKLPFREAVASSKELREEFAAEHEQLERLPRWMQNHVCRHDFLTPDKHLEWLGRAETENRALIAFCAIERFRRQQQRFPDSLAELVPEFLSAVPQDPFIDRPLSLVYKDEGYYVIYGFGIDGKDDRGENVTLWEMSDFGVQSFYRLPAIESPALP